ncbi:zf-HC2 domain-containing protein [Nonomuraea sp. NPDC050404]|uniref:anti-sigma factor family protein n=1 Tax=Nonomuraea sp. NPDC050404 TaxID=3155783 RepID=UPI0034089552
MTCEEVRIALGAHALGALEPEEALEVDHHLATCEACGAELLELEGVSSFLGKVSERDVQLVASPPRQVLDRLLNDRAKRTRRGRVLMAVASSAAVLVVGGTVWTAIQTSGSESGSSAQAPAAASSQQADAPAQDYDSYDSAEQAQPLRTVPDARKAEPSQSPTPASPRQLKTANGREFDGENEATDFYAKVLVWPSDSGTELGVQVRRIPVGETCNLVVVGVDGRRETADTWVISREDYRDKSLFRSQTTMTLREIDRFEILDRAGKTLVEVDVKKGN